MNNPNDMAELYLAAWNEADADQRRTLIEQAWTPDATYLDPMMQGEGHDGLNAMIGAAQSQFPAGLRFRRVGETQNVGNRLRFSWHLASESSTGAQDALAGGTDFCVLSHDGRLQSVTGFIDFFNAPSTDA